MQHNNRERGFLHRCWDLKERYGSLDSLDVSIYEVDIPLFFHSLDKIRRKRIGFVELVAVTRRYTSLF